MARNSGIRRLCVRWSLGLCILCASITAFSATRQNVSIPSNVDATAPGKAVATKGTGVIHVPVQEGEYIEAAKLNKRVPVKVLKTIDYSIPRTINQAKGILKGNLAQIVIGGVIAGAVGAVGWVMEDGVKIKKKINEGTPIPATQYGWKVNDGPSVCIGKKYTAPAGLYDCIIPYYQSYLGSSYKVEKGTVKTLSPGNVQVNVSATYIPNGSVNTVSYGGRVFPEGACLAPSYLVGYECLAGGPQYGDVTAADIDTTFADYAASQNAEWLKGLLRESCQGSSSPEACMQSLRDNTAVSGPSSVTADKTVSTGTYLKPDGTYGTTRTEVTTNYNIKYGPTYFDFSEQKATTIYKDGQKISDETTGETDDVVEEKPAEEDKEDADPCVTGCDGPAYADLYKPTDKTKEGEIDSYSSRVKNIPIMKAVVGLFDVDAGSSACPVWEAHNELEVWGHTSQIDLVFDYHCLPWFVDLRVFVQSIVMIGFAYLAIRIGLL